MFRCDLFSSHGTISPTKVDVSCVLLDGCVGKGLANITYTLGKCDMGSSAYHFTTATHYFTSDGECNGRIEFNSFVVTAESESGSVSRQYDLDEFSDFEDEFDSLKILSGSGNTHPSHSDMILRTDGKTGLRKLHLSIGFITEIKGNHRIEEGDFVLSYSNTWPSGTSVSYSVSCLLCNWKQINVECMECPDGDFSWKIKPTEKCLLLIYSKKQCNNLEDVHLSYSLSCRGKAKSPFCLLGSSVHSWLPPGYIFRLSLPPIEYMAYSASVNNGLYPNEFIFLIDCSGSMSGSNILETIRTVHVALKSLTVGSYFNVIAFGSTYRNVFQSSVKYSAESLEKASAFVSQLDATLGGTNLICPLRWLVKQPLQQGLARQIFIITDGEANSPAEVISLMQRHSKDVRCHLFGIGNDACNVLVSSLAAVSGGTAVKVTDPGALPEMFIHTLEKCAASPQICNASVHLQTLGWDVIEEYCQEHALSSPFGSTHYFVLKPKEVDQGSLRGSLKVSGFIMEEPVSYEFFFEAVISKNNAFGGILPLMIGWKKLQALANTKDIQSLKTAVTTSKCIGLRSCYVEFASKSETFPLTCLPPLLALKPNDKATCMEDKPVLIHHTRRHKVPVSPYSPTNYVKAKMSSLIGSLMSVATSFWGSSKKEEDDGEIEYSLDDFEKDQEVKKGLHWGEQGQLVLPDFYYKKPPSKMAASDDNSPKCPKKRFRPNSEDTCDPCHSGNISKVSDPVKVNSRTPPRDYFPILKLQSHDGAWLLDPVLCTTLGLSKDDVHSLCLDQSFTLSPHMSSSDKDKVTATIVVIVLFHIFFKDSQKVWKLAISKAQNWLSLSGVKIGGKETDYVKDVLFRMYNIV